MHQAELYFLLGNLIIFYPDQISNLSITSHACLCKFWFLNMPYKILHQLASENIYSNSELFHFHKSIYSPWCKLLIFLTQSSYIILAHDNFQLTISNSSLTFGYPSWFLKSFPKYSLEQTVLPSLKHFSHCLLFACVIEFTIRMLVGYIAVSFTIFWNQF